MPSYFTVDNNLASGWGSNDLAMANNAQVREEVELTTDVSPVSVQDVRSSGLGQTTRHTILETAGYGNLGIAIDSLV